MFRPVWLAALAGESIQWFRRLLMLVSFCTSLLLVVKFVAGAGSSRFPNSALGSANAGCSGVAAFGS